jgi:hypothetical protein
MGRGSKSSVLARKINSIADYRTRWEIRAPQLDEVPLEGWKLAIEPRHVEAGIEIVTWSRQSVEWYLVNGLLGGAQLAPGQEHILRDSSGIAVLVHNALGARWNI